MAGKQQLHDWDRWDRPRQVAAAVTLVSVVGGSWAMAGCTSTDCIAVKCSPGNHLAAGTDRWPYCDSLVPR